MRGIPASLKPAVHVGAQAEGAPQAVNNDWQAGTCSCQRPWFMASAPERLELETSLREVECWLLKPGHQIALHFAGERMKQSTKDQIQGSLHEFIGKAKEKAGNIANKPDLAAEGQGEKIAGKVQKKVGQIERVLEK